MVKQTQTICWLLPMNCLSVFDHFVGLALDSWNSGENAKFSIFLHYTMKEKVQNQQNATF